MLDPFKKAAAKSAEEQAAELQALVASSREERAALSTMLTQVQMQTSRLTATVASVQELEAAVARANERAEQVRTWLNQLQDATSSLADDLRQMHDMSRLIRDETAAVAAVAREVERRLGSLTEFQQLSRAADERLAALNDLADQTARRMKTLEEQAQTVERAVDQLTRLNEMIWKMDSQISRLQEADRRARDTQELIERVDEISRETAGRLEQGIAARDQLTADLNRVAEAREAVAELVRHDSDTLALGRQELAACGERIETLQSTVEALEHRVAGIHDDPSPRELPPATVQPAEPRGRRVPPARHRHDEVTGVRSGALVALLEDLRVNVESLSARQGTTVFTASSCERLRDMARETQSAIVALQSGRGSAVTSSPGSRRASSAGPLRAEPSAPNPEASAPA